MRLIVAYSASGLVHVAAIAGLACWVPRGDSWRADIAIARGEAITIASNPAAYEAEAIKIEAVSAEPVSIEARQPFPRIDVVPITRPLKQIDEELPSAGPAELPIPTNDEGVATISRAVARPLTKQSLELEHKIAPVAQLAREPSVAVPFQTAVQIGAEVDELPRKLASNVAPVYPADALSAGIQGRVLLKVDVRADGGVDAARIHESSGTSSLDEAALEAVRRWKFHPARRAGTAVAYDVLVPVRFSIR